MSGRLHRMARQAASQGRRDAVALMQKPIEAAITNEQITRRRVDALEAWRGLGLWGRLRWLFTGRFPAAPEGGNA